MIRQARIVIVDDDKNLTELLIELISRFIPESEFFTAHTGREALKLIKKELPDLIILDVKLPDINGCEVCRILKKDKLAYIPIIVITGITDKKDLKTKFLELGAEAFLNKPFDSTELIAQIRALLRLKKAEDKLKEERDFLEDKVNIQSKELDEKEERWKVIIDYVIGGIWDWDLRTDKIHLSEQWKKMLGYEKEEIKNERQFVFDLIHSADKRRFRKSVTSYLTRKEPSLNSEIRLRCKDGTYRWFLYRGHALWNEKGKPVRLIGVHFDITDHKEQVFALEKMALYDSLTRLPNRVLFYDYTEKMIAAAKRSKERIGILFLDLDNFKMINDTYGHSYGDKVLVKVAERLKSLIRPFDFVGRFGGDEFMVALYNLQSEVELDAIIQRLTAGIEQPIKLKGKKEIIRFSLGTSVYPIDAEDIDTLLKIADKDMYSEKKAKQIK